MTQKALTLFEPVAMRGHTVAPSCGQRFALAGIFLGFGLFAGCAADRPLRTPDVGQAIRAELPPPAPMKAAVQVPARISEALAEPVPLAQPVAPEPRLDLLVNNAQAREVFLAIVADTRYSMLMHPDVAGTLSVTLRGVTVVEALEAIRDVYGYDFKMDGRRITIYAPTLQTRIFTVNYPTTRRSGSSDMRVSSGPSQAGGGGGGLDAISRTDPRGDASRTDFNAGRETSSLKSTYTTDYWSELAGAVRSLVGIDDSQATGVGKAAGSPGVSGRGRSVVVSPQAGIMAVRAMPDELREVEQFLKASKIAVERQVMLEAKIVEVELRDGYQSGIDWSALKNGGNSTGAMGVIGGNTNSSIDSSVSTITSTNTLVRGVQSNLPGFATGSALLADGVSLPAAGAGLFGLAFARDGFQAVLGFLETQGDVQILSSPRIATLNNQKAVLKVGTDDYFVTKIAGTSTSSAVSSGTTNGSSVNSMPDITLASFFSGISLDVTPQVDDGVNVTLHVHPSVTMVSEKSKQIDLGTAGNYRLPLASSNVNESDTVVRIQDGNIVAIGGLMQIESNRKSSGLPGTSELGFFSSLLGNKANTGRKKEVVVLIKPTIIRSAQDWEAQTRRSREALDDMDAVRTRVIRIDGSIDNSRAESLAQ